MPSIHNKISAAKLAQLIDHTLLNPSATQDQIYHLCEEARLYKFCSVCVAPTWAKIASETLSNSNVKVAVVIGFPHGNTLPEVKAFEAQKVIEHGANEVDMVINIGALKSAIIEHVKNDIEGVVKVAHMSKAIAKVIIETAFLNNSEKILSCKIAQEAGADFVKTSTGFASGGATVDDVRLMRKTVGKNMGVKAAGGIRDYETACKMIEAGANRLGCSSSVGIISQVTS
jgi:deoxyribose-phosphate aldolase